MIKSHRRITSLFLVMIYLLTVFSPVVSLAMQLKRVTHTATVECTGNCSIDGCSPERSAAHTCCCWQKKRGNNGEYRHQASAGCCSSLAKPSVRGSGCCNYPVVTTGKDNVEATAATSARDQKKTTTIRTAPCRSIKLCITGEADDTRYMPFFFVELSTSPDQSTIIFIQPDRLTSLHVKPPTPPPELA